MCSILYRAPPLKLYKVTFCREFSPNLKAPSLHVSSGLGFTIMGDFSLRFSKAEVSIWAKRYAYGDDTRLKNRRAEPTCGLLHSAGLLDHLRMENARATPPSLPKKL